MSRTGYSSTQGSKISKPEGCGEDGDGWMQQEGFRAGRVGGGVGFCSSPSPPGSPEKITEQADSSQLPNSSPRLAGTGRQMLELQQGVQMIPARHSHAVGRSHNTSGSHTHTRLKHGAHGLLIYTHTQHSLEWLSKMETHSAKLFLFFLSSKMTINASR